MTSVLVFLIIVFVLAALVGSGWYVYLRRQRREAKNIERGLKMVPLLIHLPPLSDDTEGNGRDARDLVDENISKAQVIYNIIASTLEKGNKRHVYGQRHFGFEVVGSRGFVSFYAIVPISLVEVVKQALVSAYPAVQLEEVPEHNIFSRVGGINTVVGGELVLKESFAFPIATYQDIKRDTMQALLNALSTLEKEDGVGLQLLMRPASEGWRKTATVLSSKKRKGEDKPTGAGGYAKQLATAFWKAPEATEQKQNDISGLDQSIVDSIDEKTRHTGYEVLIRVVASSNVFQRSQAVLSQVVATFSLFDSPGKNGFKYEPAKDVHELVTNYILRIFPQQRTKDILNSIELATLFHFPDQRNIPTSQLERQGSKQVDGPRNMPEDGMLLGYNIFRGAKKPIRLAVSDRQRHLYSVGQTGTGKSTFLENLALQDMIDGNGFAFIDPHGDTAEKLLSMVPRERTEDVIYFSPGDMEFPMGLNLFEAQSADQKDFLVQEAINMLYKLYDPQHQGIIGPRYEHLFRNAALTVMAGPDGGTFIDIPKLFVDSEYLEQKLQYVKDQGVLDFWRKEMVQAKRSNEFGDLVNWFSSKFGAFRSNSMMANIIGQTKSAFDLRDIMDNKKILLVNLSKGRMGDLNSKLLGMIFVMKIQAAAMSRANIAEDQRVDFALYVDEFQNFSTDSFATILSEARKYHLNLMVANQFTTQLTEEIRDAVFGNIGTIVSFRIGQNDVEALSRYFQPVFDGDDLLRVPNHNAIVRTLINGVPTQAFSMATLPPLGTPNDKLGTALKQLTAAKYGRPRKEVEDEITKRLATAEVPPQPGQAPYGGGAPQSFAPAPASQAGSMAPQTLSPSADKPATGGSFLDQWMQKRKTAQPSANSSAAPMPPAPPLQPSPAATKQLQPIAAPPSTPPSVTASPPMPAYPVVNGAVPGSTAPVSSASMNETTALPSLTDNPAAQPSDLQRLPLDASAPADVAETRAQNISSDEINRREIKGIADELKQQLHDKEPAVGGAAASSNTPVVAGANEPSGVGASVAENNQNEPETDDGDTIYIDPEGTLHIRQHEPSNDAVDKSGG